MEGDRDSSWVLVDLGDIIVHVFQTEEMKSLSAGKIIC